MRHRRRNRIQSLLILCCCGAAPGWAALSNGGGSAAAPGEFSSVPEPGGMALLAAGVCALLARARIRAGKHIDAAAGRH